MYGFYHPRANTHRLYFHCSWGGRGLTGLEDTHSNECSVLGKYIVKSDYPLTQMVRETISMTQKFLLKLVSAPLYITPDLMDEQHAQELCARPLYVWEQTVVTSYIRKEFSNKMVIHCAVSVANKTKPLYTMKADDHNMLVSQAWHMHDP
eukprot:13361195-Ditylum_brightwellii.AAC.1